MESGIGVASEAMNIQKDKDDESLDGVYLDDTDAQVQNGEEDAPAGVEKQEEEETEKEEEEENNTDDGVVNTTESEKDTTEEVPPAGSAVRDNPETELEVSIERIDSIVSAKDPDDSEDAWDEGADSNADAAVEGAGDNKGKEDRESMLLQLRAALYGDDANNNEVAGAPNENNTESRNTSPAAAADETTKNDHKDRRSFLPLRRTLQSPANPFRPSGSVTSDSSLGRDDIAFRHDLLSANHIDADSDAISTSSAGSGLLGKSIDAAAAEDAYKSVASGTVTRSKVEMHMAEVIELRARLDETLLTVEGLKEERRYNTAQITELQELLAASDTHEEIGVYLKQKAMQVGQLKHEVATLRRKLIASQLETKGLAQERDANRALLVELSKIFRATNGTGQDEPAPPSGSVVDSIGSGKVLSTEEALMLTVEKLRNKIEQLEEDRDSTQHQMNALRTANTELSQERDAFRIKAVALEQQVLLPSTPAKPGSPNSEAETASITSTPKTEASFSVSGLSSPGLLSPSNSSEAVEDKPAKVDRLHRFRKWVPRRRNRQSQKAQ